MANMRNFAAFAAFAAGAHAFVPRDTSCCFHLTASGGASGPVGQLGDGQNRVGGDSGSLPEGQFCINSDGSITDGSGRGCILTPPTTQFQCDLGGNPTPGFSVDSSGLLGYNGQTSFVACATGENGEMNIYTSPNSGDVTGCVSVQLTADSCLGTGPGGGAGGGTGGGQESGQGATPSPSVPGGGGAGGGQGPGQGTTPAPSVPGGGGPGSQGPVQSTATVPVISPSPSVPGGGTGVGPGSQGPGQSTATVPVISPSPSVPGGGTGVGPGSQGPVQSTATVPVISPSPSVPGGGTGVGPGSQGPGQSTATVPVVSPSPSVPGGGAGGGEGPGQSSTTVPVISPSPSVPGGGAGGGPGQGTETVPVISQSPSVPGGGAGGGEGPGASPSPSAPGGGAGGGAGGGQSTVTVPIVSPSPSIPGGGAGGGEVPDECASCPATTTVYTTVTVDCTTETPGVPGGEVNTPGVPGGIEPGQPPSTETPVGPGGGGGGAQPTGPAGGGETPTVPGGGVGQPTGPAGGGTGGQPPSQPQPSGGSCPTDLSGNYEFPHLIIPIDSSSPDEAYGTQFNGTVTPTVSTIFNFDIPAADAGKTCSLVFLFPRQEDLETSAFDFSGDGTIQFSAVETPATQSTTYNNAPQISQNFGQFIVSPGNSYTVSSFECPAGQTVGYEMSTAGSTNLEFFEDYNPSPIGLFITVC
ncbi:ubiquitin 3 binding protein But2 C-terminal domain-containing protein [Aspergillus falconensis]